MNCEPKDLYTGALFLLVYAIFEYYLGKKSSSLLGVILSFVVVVSVYIISKMKGKKDGKE